MPKGIAYKQHVDARAVKKPRHCGVVGSQHYDSFATLLHQGKISHTKLLW
jgi:hypothetical protein